MAACEGIYLAPPSYAELLQPPEKFTWPCGGSGLLQLTEVSDTFWHFGFSCLTCRNVLALSATAFDSVR